MGKITIQHGIGYSSESGAQFFNLSAMSEFGKEAEAIKQVTAPDDNPARKWSPWGKNNLKPKEMAADIKTCGILNSIIDGKARFAMGSGIVPAIVNTDEKTGQRVIEKYVNDAEINDFLDANNDFDHVYAWMRDGLGFGQGVARYGLNVGRDKIATFQRDDVSEYRLEKKNEKGKISNIWLSAEWEKVTGALDNRVFSVPLLSYNNPSADLAERVKHSKDNSFALVFRYPDWDKQYYPDPLWYAAYKWVKIAQGVPEMKAAIFENSIHVKYVVVIQESHWPKAFGADNWKKYNDKEREEAYNKVYDEIDKFLVGSKNAYKSVFTSGYRDRDGKTWTDIEITPVDDTMKDGKLLPDSAAANSEIAFAMHYNNSIIGGNQASGLYEQSQGGSNIRESILLQVILMEFERKNIRRIMNVIKFFNKWNVRFPGLEFVIPTTILTTLDTGAGSKPVVPGSANPKQDGTDKGTGGSEGGTA